MAAMRVRDRIAVVDRRVCDDLLPNLHTCPKWLQREAIDFLERWESYKITAALAQENGGEDE